MQKHPEEEIEMINMKNTQNATKLTNAFSNEHYLNVLPMRQSSCYDMGDEFMGEFEGNRMTFPTRMDSRDKHAMLKTDGLSVQFVNNNNNNQQQEHQQQLRQSTTPPSSSPSLNRQTQMMNMMNMMSSPTTSTSVWDESFVSTPNALFDHPPARGYGIRANESIPPGCGIFYFEVTILRDSSKQQEQQQQESADDEEGTINDEIKLPNLDNNRTNEGLNGSIFIGLITANVSLNYLPGTTPERFSYCYESKHGMIFSNTHSSSTSSTSASNSGTPGGTNQEVFNGRPYSSAFSVNDTVGCCINFLNQTIHFTKNGEHAGVAFHKVPKVLNLFPCIALTDSSQLVQVNFGSHPFQYNLRHVMLHEGRDLVKSWIEEEVNLDRDICLNTSHVPSKLRKGEAQRIDVILRQFVLSHLVHQGYTETAKLFARDIFQANSQSLHDDEPTNSPMVIEEEEGDHKEPSVLDRSVIDQMKYRQTVMGWILDRGDVDSVLNSLLSSYPNIYRERFDIIFALKCHKFLEMYHQQMQQYGPCSPAIGSRAVSLANLVQYGRQELVPMIERDLLDIVRKPHFDENSNYMVTSSDEEEDLLDEEDEENDDLTERGNAYNLQHSQYREKLDILFSLLAYVNPSVDSVPKHLASLLHLKEQREELAQWVNQALLDFYSSFDSESLTSENQFAVPLMERVLSQSEACLTMLAETHARHGGYSFISYKDFV